MMFNRLLLCFIINIACFNISFAKIVDNSFADVVEDLMPMVVNISTTQKASSQQKQIENLLPQLPKDSPFRYFFKEFLEGDKKKQGSQKKLSSLGSGFIVSADGYIVTNNHVVNKADIIDIKFHDGTVARARIIGVDSKSDIALLKIDTDIKLPYVKFANSDLLRVGDWVIAIGNPFGLGGTVTAGIVSARGRNISDGSNTDFIQTDAAINRGNSGGPMFNSKGELIGISTAIFSNSGGNIGIGFAIPSQTALPLIKQLKKNGKVVRGWLGVNIQDITPALAEALGLEDTKGAYVVAVVKDGPAAKAGIKGDDLIIKFNDKEINNVSTLPNIVANTEIGKNVKVTILRNVDNKLVRKNLIVKILQLNSHLVADKKLADSKKSDQVKYKEYIGFKLANLTKELRAKYQVKNDDSGVLVVGFSNDIYNLLSGIETGDLISKVNQQVVNSVDDFIKVVKKSKKDNKQHILLSIKRGNITAAITLNVADYN
jgi:serine protease Do